MKTSEHTQDPKKPIVKTTEKYSEKIKGDLMQSENDEVKEAERKMREDQKKKS